MCALSFGAGDMHHALYSGHKGQCGRLGDRCLAFLYFSFAAFSVVCVVLILIPIINFLFCALDKERNLKNIVSVISCFTAVFLILSFIPRQNISIGSIVAIMVYVLIMFITSIAMVMRLSKDVEDKK